MFAEFSFFFLVVLKNNRYPWIRREQTIVVFAVENHLLSVILADLLERSFPLARWSFPLTKALSTRHAFPRFLIIDAVIVYLGEEFHYSQRGDVWATSRLLSLSLSLSETAGLCILSCNFSYLTVNALTLLARINIFSSNFNVNKWLATLSKESDKSQKSFFVSDVFSYHFDCVRHLCDEWILLKNRVFLWVVMII